MNEKKVEQENVISLSHLLREFRSVLRKRFWLPLLLAVVCGGAWFLYQRSRYTPMYASEVTFTISVSSSSSSDISRTSAYYSKATAEQLSKTFPYLIQSDLLYTKLSQAMGVSRINGTITAANVPDTNLFTVRVTSSSADDALAILQKLIEVYPEVADYVIGNTSMDLLTEPYVASAPYNAFHPFHVLRNDAPAGLAAGLLLLMLAAGLRRTIREERDVQLHLNQTCLAALPCVSFREKESPPAFHQQRSDLLCLSGGRPRTPHQASSGAVRDGSEGPARIEHHARRGQDDRLRQSGAVAGPQGRARHSGGRRPAASVGQGGARHSGAVSGPD